MSVVNFIDVIIAGVVDISGYQTFMVTASWTLVSHASDVIINGVITVSVMDVWGDRFFTLNVGWT